jgi:hypothetical protein
MKLCTNCKHFKGRLGTEGLCRRKGVYTSPVTGKTEYILKFCNHERSDIFRCGEKGRYYEEKIKVDNWFKTLYNRYIKSRKATEPFKVD